MWLKRRRAKAREAARRDYLTFLQNLYGSGVSSPGLPRNEDEFALQVMSAKGISGADSERILAYALESVETHSQDGGHFFTSDTYVRREAAKVLAAFGPKTKREIQRNVTFGSLPLPDLNGMCIKAPEGGHLVLMNFGTLALSEVLANVLSGLVTFGQEEQQSDFTPDQAAGFLLEEIAEFPMYSDGYVDRYERFRYVGGGSNPEKQHFCSSLGDALTNYVIAHEIAHFVRGHVNDNLLRAAPIGGPLSKKVTVEYLHYRRQQEFEADVLGAAILVLGAENTGDQMDAIAAMIATQVFFLALDLMEEVKKLKSPTHPAAQERRRHLLQVFDYRDDVLESVNTFQDGIFEEAKKRISGRKIAMEIAMSANALIVNGRLQEATDRLEEAGVLADAVGSVSTEVAARAARASLFMRSGRSRKALAEYRRIKEIVGDLKHLRDGDNILVQAALAYSEIGEIDLAIDNLRSAIAIVKDRGESKWEGRYLYNLGLVWVKSEDYWEALRCFSQAWSILSQRGDEEDSSLVGTLSEGIVKLKALLMQRITQEEGDMESKMQKMAELLDI